MKNLQKTALINWTDVGTLTESFMLAACCVCCIAAMVPVLSHNCNRTGEERSLRRNSMLHLQNIPASLCSAASSWSSFILQEVLTQQKSGSPPSEGTSGPFGSDSGQENQNFCRIHLMLLTETGGDFFSAGSAGSEWKRSDQRRSEERRTKDAMKPEDVPDSRSIWRKPDLMKHGGLSWLLVSFGRSWRPPAADHLLTLSLTLDERQDWSEEPWCHVGAGL